VGGREAGREAELQGGKRGREAPHPSIPALCQCSCPTPPHPTPLHPTPPTASRTWTSLCSPPAAPSPRPLAPSPPSPAQWCGRQPGGSAGGRRAGKGHRWASRRGGRAPLAAAGELGPRPGRAQGCVPGVRQQRWRRRWRQMFNISGSASPGDSGGGGGSQAAAAVAVRRQGRRPPLTGPGPSRRAARARSFSAGGG
jgi:hypothetical protein